MLFIITKVCLFIYLSCFVKKVYVLPPQNYYECCHQSVLDVPT